MSNEPYSPATKRTGILVLGLGNVLLGDDGLGAAAVARLEAEYSAPPDVQLADGGTLGLSLLGEGPPGSLVRLDGEDVGNAVRDRLSPHQVGVADLLDAARLIDHYPTTVTLLGLIPEAMDLAVVRSPVVDARLDDLVAAIVHEVQSHGYQMVREPEVAGRPRSVHTLARHFGM